MGHTHTNTHIHTDAHTRTRTHTHAHSHTELRSGEYVKNLRTKPSQKRQTKHPHIHIHERQHGALAPFADGVVVILNGAAGDHLLGNLAVCINVCVSVRAVAWMGGCMCADRRVRV